MFNWSVVNKRFDKYLVVAREKVNDKIKSYWLYS